MISAYVRKSVAALSSLVLQPKVAAILRRSLVLTGLRQVCEEADQVAVFPFKSVFYEVAHSFVINRTKILNPHGILKTSFSFFPRRAVLQFVGGVEAALQGSAVFEIVFRGEEPVEFGGGRFK